MKAIVVAALVIGGCGGTPPTPAGIAAAIPAAETAPSPDGAFVQTLPRPLVDAIGDTPLLVQDFNTMLLFGNERLEADQLIADWARANGLTVLDPKDTEASVAAGAAGLDPRSRAACGPSLPREVALARWVHAGGNLEVRVDCEAQQCTLQVAFTLDGRGTEFYGAPFQPNLPWQQGLHDALAHARDTGGHDAHGHGNNPVAIAGGYRRTDSEDLVFDDTKVANHAELGGALASTCKLGQLGVSVLLDATGRCERFADPQLITESDPVKLACACTQIVGAMTVPVRTVVRVDGNLTDGALATTNGKVVRAQLWGGDPRSDAGVPWFQPSTIYPYVPECFVDRTAAVPSQRVEATIGFDRTGVVQVVQLGTSPVPLTPAEQTCLTAKLKLLRTPCSDEPHPVGTVSIDWAVSEPAP